MLHFRPHKLSFRMALMAAMMLFVSPVFGGPPYELFTSGEYAFKIDVKLEAMPQASPEQVLRAFLAKGGTLHRITA